MSQRAAARCSTARTCSGRPPGFPEQVAEAAKVAGRHRGPARRPTRSTTCSSWAWAAAASPATSWRRRRAVPARCPIVVSKGYAPPAFVGAGHAVLRRVVLGRHRGDDRGRPGRGRRRGPLVVVATGGELARAGAEPGRCPPCRCPTASRSPAPALGALAVPLLLAARADRPVPRGDRVGRRRRRASSKVRRGRPRRRRRRRSRSPARSARTIPLVFGAGPLGGVAAARWKTQVNENAKAPGVRRHPARAVPQRDRRLGPARRRDPPGVHAGRAAPRRGAPPGARRFELVRELLAEVVHDMVEVRAEGEGALAQLLRPGAASATTCRCRWPPRRASTPAPSRSSTT